MNSFQFPSSDLKTKLNSDSYTSQWKIKTLWSWKKREKEKKKKKQKQKQEEGNNWNFQFLSKLFSKTGRSYCKQLVSSPVVLRSDTIVIHQNISDVFLCVKKAYVHTVLLFTIRINCHCKGRRTSVANEIKKKEACLQMSTFIISSHNSTIYGCCHMNW